MPDRSNRVRNAAKPVGPIEGNTRGRRSDLHCVSRYSLSSGAWIPTTTHPRALEPDALYDRLKALGIDFVTLTDTDSIDGAMAIAHHADVFVSEEITSQFPEDGFAVRILAYGISAEDHDEIARMRADLYALLALLRERQIAHAVARPLGPARGPAPTQEQIEKLLLLVPLWETRNGQLGPDANLLAERFLREATPEFVGALAARHALPLPPRPLAGSVGGSDDFSSHGAGRSLTRTPTEGGIAEFLADLRAARSIGEGEHGSAEQRAHALYSLAEIALSESPELLPEQSLEFAKGFARTLDAAGVVEPERALISGLRGILRETLGDVGGAILNHFASAFRGSMRETLQSPKVLTDLIGAPFGDRLAERGSHGAIFREVNARYIAAMTRYAESLRSLSSGPREHHVRELGALVGFHLLLLPYLVSYFQTGEERRTALRVARAITARPRFRPGAPRIAVFTDTYFDTNGIVTILERLEQWGIATGHDITIVTATGEREVRRDGFISLPVITEFGLPAYRDYALHFPSCLSVLELARSEAYDLIHVVTPGPVGISALLAARLLGIPLLGSYHTQLPEYARILTGNESLERVTWEFMRYFYSKCERILVPSQLQLEDLARRGFAKERLGLLPAGVDTRQFNPARRSDAFREAAGAKGKTLFLYVGRISREKDLELLADAYKRVLAEDAKVRLAFVGDGPLRADLEASLGATAHFTGVLKGEELAAAFASADVFVFPSATDTLGCVVLEAMASGLPPIVTDGGGAQESVRDGETGLVARAGNVTDFAAKMHDLASDARRRRAMGVRARAAALEVSWDKAFEKLYGDYEELSTHPTQERAPAQPAVATAPAPVHAPAPRDDEAPVR
ncbi:MAG: glycosyltransferase [bacterium]